MPLLLPDDVGERLVEALERLEDRLKRREETERDEPLTAPEAARLVRRSERHFYRRIAPQLDYINGDGGGAT